MARKLSITSIQKLAWELVWGSSGKGITVNSAGTGRRCVLYVCLSYNTFLYRLMTHDMMKIFNNLNMPIELKLSHSYESESQELDSSLVSSSESASRASVSVVDHRNKLESKSCWCIRTKILRNTRADEITHSSRWDNSAGAYCLQKG
jgi:hypothetical protein